MLEIPKYLGYSNTMPDLAEDLKYLKDGWVPTDEELKSHILDLLACEHLVVLTGSGTSLEQSLIDAGSPSMGHLLTAAKDLDGYEVAHEKFGAEPDDIEKFLSWCMLYSQLGQPEHETVSAFYQAAENLIRQKCDYVKADTPLAAHETFLAKAAARSSDLPRLQLFTTNYDRAFEEAATRLSMVPLDGFDFSSKPRFNGKHFDLDLVTREAGRREPEFVKGVFKLLKVHGSVDWDESQGVTIKSSNPADPAMIYPQSGKYEASYDSPFLDLMSRFQRALRQENLGLLILGYGFRDRHLNNPILLALKENLSLRLVVVDKFWSYDDEEESDKSTAHKALKALADNNPRVARLVKGTFGQFAQYMPQYLTPTEREQYEKAGH